MHRNQLLELLANYRTPFIEEAAMVARAQRFVGAHENCFERSLLAGHVTASAWVVNPARSHVMLLHHRKLNMWLQPGGHADGMADICAVALAETAEESGIDPAHIKLLSAEIFDFDVHVVHANAREPRHFHFDPRFLVEIDDRLDLPGNNESNAVKWVPLGQVLRYNNARSIYRMVQKTVLR
jgi:8-oxo-dGTP pyrophosphatase MutT (NUDIX family)